MTETVEIPLSQGLVAVVDAADAPAVLGAGKWCAHRQGTNTYAVRSMRQADGRRAFVRMHNFITGWSFVDHRDGNGLNNTRSNLRPADAVTNGRNHRRAVNNKSGYVGVYWFTRQSEWRAYIYDRGRNIYLGKFSGPVEAARARDAAAVELHGAFARLNFPRSTEHECAPGGTR
jgi:hypothetical protein